MDHLNAFQQLVARSYPSYLSRYFDQLLKINMGIATESMTRVIRAEILDQPDGRDSIDDNEGLTINSSRVILPSKCATICSI